MLTLGAALQVLSHALRSWKPPFPLLTITFFIVSLGQAFQDTHANTFVAGLKGGKSHRWLAFIHAMYSAGCLCGPFAATAVSAAWVPSLWYLFYTIPLGLGAGNLVLVSYAFRDDMKVSFPRKITESTKGTGVETESVASSPSATGLIKRTFGTPSVWLLCMFFFFYLGAVLTASGWVVEYLVVVRDGDLSDMGYVAAGFAGGGLLGRILLAEPPHRYGERRVIFGYLVLCVAFQLLFWL
jgi:fucose permease